MKYLVKTTGSFMLMNMVNREEISESRPSVVTPDYFIQSRAAVGQLVILYNDLRDEATDAEFAAYLKESDGDVDLAVASFYSAFGPGPAAEAPVKPKGRRGAKES